ncbi:hypothetical protein C8J45_101817 [Sphingomonas sp. PP-CE-3G-477]|uniref:hypothetical protein n=1 Tax=Sphingomonas sp. PP-CE-3G-477 TaxID=2135660 RepID=UPI000D3D00B4|nr:hypothetical protein [Sphingomonas sp. PP-CE-3G-477]PTQ65953.1 hypothetical protein C8J45_101817 [Sphingomonas sp. PP-CE-3G-477]
MTALRFDTYDWSGGREAMLRFGADADPIVIAALPLFEEANRTRQFLVTILRALAVLGIGSVLPDLPGTGESIVVTGEARLRDQRTAYTELAQRLGRNTYGISIRSGALFDTEAGLAGRWQLSPQTGEDLLRELDRTRATSRSAPASETDYAGNTLSREMLADLHDAKPYAGAGPLRVVRLESDPRDADVKYVASPLWRRLEPDNDIALAQILAGDISHWIASCER